MFMDQVLFTTQDHTLWLLAVLVADQVVVEVEVLVDF
jgi:hypothetical protein